MNKIGWILVAAIALSQILCSHKEENKNGNIKGQLLHADGKTVFLTRLSESGETVLDSAIIDEHGRFLLKNLADGLDYYLFRIDSTKSAYLILKGGEYIEINGDANDFNNTYVITGSKDSELARTLKKYDKYLSDSLFMVYKKYGNANPVQRDSIGTLMQNTYTDRMQAYSKAFIKRYPTSLVSLSAVRYLDNQKDIDMMVQLEQSLSKAYPGNKYVIDYSTVVASLKLLPIGSEAPEIDLNNPDGKTVKLSSLRGKVVLIDFWASWCQPCRKENPELVAMYKKYKQRGFEIYGVSLDDSKDNWKQAIKADGLPWVQVSELKKWNAEVVKVYHVEAIPFSVLLDREGKVAAKGIRGKELEQKLEKLL